MNQKLLHDNSENLFLKKQLLSNVPEWDNIQFYSALKDDSESILSYKLEEENFEQIFPLIFADKSHTKEESNKDVDQIEFWKLYNIQKENKALCSDKNDKELIQQKIKEKILLKRPFKGKKFLGRKIKIEEGLGEHNKFSDDNLRRKVKHLVLKNVFDFINEKIRSMYSDINKGIFTKQLLTINQKQISDATILFNKKFLEKPLKDIFSVEISKRYTNYLESHNKNLINFLMNEEEDENKRVYFNNLFNLKFIECLEHFRGTADYIHLEGMKTFDEIKDDFAKDKNYLDVLTNYVEEYENITRNKKERTEFSYDY